MELSKELMSKRKIGHCITNDMSLSKYKIFMLIMAAIILTETSNVSVVFFVVWWLKSLLVDLPGRVFYRDSAIRNRHVDRDRV